MSTKYIIIALLLTGSMSCTRMAQYSHTTCRFPCVRSATDEDLRYFTNIVPVLANHPMAIREITGFVEQKRSNVLELADRDRLPPLPRIPTFREYPVTPAVVKTVISALQRAAIPIEIGYDALDSRTIMISLGDDLPYGKVMVLSVKSDNTILAHFEARSDFPGEAEVFFTVPGLDTIIRNTCSVTNAQDTSEEPNNRGRRKFEPGRAKD